MVFTQASKMITGIEMFIKQIFTMSMLCTRLFPLPGWAMCLSLLFHLNRFLSGGKCCFLQIETCVGCRRCEAPLFADKASVEYKRDRKLIIWKRVWKTGTSFRVTSQSHLYTDIDIDIESRLPLRTYLHYTTTPLYSAFLSKEEIYLMGAI